MKIKGKNIALRGMEKADIANKVRWFNNPDVNKTLLMDEKLDLVKSLEWFDKSRKDSSRQDFVIESNDENR